MESSDETNEKKCNFCDRVFWYGVSEHNIKMHIESHNYENSRQLSVCRRTKVLYIAMKFKQI